MHSTDDLGDGYLGSGQRLWKSINKYGKDLHYVEVLEHLPDRRSLALREKELLAGVVRIDPLCMNIATGGEGFFDRPSTKEETRRKMRVAQMGRVVTEETRKKISTANTGLKRTAEYIEKMKARETGRKRPPRTEDHRKKISAALKGKPTALHTAECKQQIRESLQRTFAENLAKYGTKRPPKEST